MTTGSWFLQPVYLLGVREGEYEFVHNSIYADRATDQFKGRVVGVTKDEVVAVELRQALPANATSHLIAVRQGALVFRGSTYRGNMVDIGL